MLKVRISKNEWYPVYELTSFGGSQVKVTSNLLSHYDRVMREFTTLQVELGKLLEVSPKPPKAWRYNLPDDDPAKLYPKKK